MSKWLKKELFDKFLDQKKDEDEKAKRPAFERNKNIWPTPDKGTEEEAAVYEGRFLPDPQNNFYKKYYYHFWQSGSTVYNFMCEKTFVGFGGFCPFCSLVSILYNGTEEDKKLARAMKRKERFIANWFVVDDPRDKKATKPEDKHAGKVFIYPFPSKVEEKLKAEEDDKNGLRSAIFDPGEDGYNFILKVKSTKADANKKTFPDYSSSTFARRPSALGKDKEIDEIMKSCLSLTDHINGLRKDRDAIRKVLIQENLFQLVEREWNKNYLIAEANGGSPSPNKEDDVPESVGKDPASSVSKSDSELLDQLENLKF